MKWPDVYAFGQPIGPADRWFAWRPVQLWWGKWVWLRTVQRARIIKYSDLPGPDWEIWSYELPNQHHQTCNPHRSRSHEED